jgi:hypothetical protein
MVEYFPFYVLKMIFPARMDGDAPTRPTYATQRRPRPILPQPGGPVLRTHVLPRHQRNDQQAGSTALIGEDQLAISKRINLRS